MRNITTPPEEDQATATGTLHTRLTALCPGLPRRAGARKVKHVHKKFGEDRTCNSEDTITDRQTHRHKHARLLGAE